MYKEKIVNAITGEETWRDYTKDEIAQVEKAQAKAAEKIAEAETRHNARQSALAKLAALGLTEEEIAAL